MKYIVKLALLLLLPALVMVSCSRDEDINTPQGEFITLTLSPGLGNAATRATHPGSTEDQHIAHFRALVFNHNAGGTGTLIHNTGKITGQSTTVTLYEGVYDFVFITNEDSDAAFATTLTNDYTAGSKTLADLDNLYVSASGIIATKDIPMSGIYRNVDVRTTGYLLLNDGDILGTTPRRTAQWQAKVTRLGIRVDVRLFTEIVQNKNACTGISFQNLPDKVPLLAELHGGGANTYEAATPITRTYYIANGDTGTPDYSAGFQTVGGGGWDWKKTRIILPSSLFSPVTAAAKGISAHVQYGTVANDGIFVLVPDLATDYAALRNSYYFVDATLHSTQVYISAKDWGDVNVNADVSQQQLNVEFLEVATSNKAQTRIHFWSDQPSAPANTVYVEPIGYTNPAEGSANEFTVNNVFNDLSDISATPSPYCNLHYNYNASNGSGYIDIAPKASAATGDYYIYLYANGLRRRIKVSVTNVGSAYPAWASSKYVGAFWRNSQTGERLVTGANAGEWTAEVDDPTGQGDFVVLAKGKTTDQTIWTATPADPENFQIGGTKITGGIGEIAFRIGLTGTLGVGVNPRYARVKVTPNISVPGTFSYVYVRQGEKADYVFPVDGGRPNAVRWSPYNLTDPLNGAGGSTLASHNTVDLYGGQFTDYPSQAGYLFHWATTALRVAFHPTEPSTGAISSWPANTITTAYWGAIRSTYGVCPTGYDLPTDGSITAAMGSYGDYTTSEFKHSLWVTFTSGIDNNITGNLDSGCYADGFFDRRAIVAPPAGTGLAVSYHPTLTSMNRLVAYNGRLIFNPSTYASLFFPFAGQRSPVDGTLQGTGEASVTWGSSAAATISARAFVLENSQSLLNGGIRNWAFSMRCVTP
jgi:hypothetical protein